MSSSMNLEADAIQHIDDACEEEYIESFAPKAQEEVLSEIQTGDSDLNSNLNDENDISRNTVDELAESSEPVDISNDEEINATSNELVHEVMSEIESNMILEDEKISNDLGNKSIIIEDNVIIDEQSTNEYKIHESTFENSNIDENSNENITNAYTNLEDEEKVVENIEVDEEKVVENTEVENEEEVVENTEVENEEKVVEETETKSDEATEILPEIITPKVEISEKTSEPSYSPSKGKDVKSLSSAYGREENLINVDCCVCNKKVYPMEKLVANDKTFHKMCFRCSKCKSALSTGNYSFNQQRPYCTPHYFELFKKRGRYDEIDDNVEKEIPVTNDINDVLTDELPAPDTTKKIVAKFQNFETGNTSSVNQNSNIDSVDELPAPNTTKNLMEKFSAIQQEKSEGKCKPQIDIPRHANGHSNGTSENVPVELPTDVVRANDPSQDDRPEQGITKNLVNRFRGMGGSLNN